ncbi:MAG: AAA family ATPase [Gammaproteobacteria bacterium]|nr:AAA family ATPase [Gammaproteobacteria bacterium]HAN81213.1 AAA family ATPase [Gammaproteobacteria bacterium]
MSTLRTTLLELANRFLETLPNSVQEIDWGQTLCARWVHDRANMGHLRILHPRLDQTFEGLIGVDKQARQFKANLELFLKGLPANATLLWGARGTGKSSMVRAALTAFHDRGLRIIEVEKSHLGDLPAIVENVRSERFQFLIYCDDLTFEDGERGYSGLKTVLDGTLEEFGTNILVVCTSNRRHLVSEPMRDNQNATVVDGEIHQGDAIEERVSLADRFGLWLSFYPFPQDTYIAIVKHWYTELGRDLDLPEFTEQMAVEANRFAIGRGGRGGRVARQFVIDQMAKQLLANST